jgi:phosphoserine phosphatase RsbU/P
VSTIPPPPTAPQQPPQNFSGKTKSFWLRVTDGLEINQLWHQFRTDARSSYRLYSRGIDVTTPDKTSRRKHWWAVAKQFFWAILLKLSPARRVLLLVALALIVFNPEFDWTTSSGTHIIGFDFRLIGGLLMFLLLVLEVSERVVMKRDLEIARDIQRWLLPLAPPPVPGVEIAFATRPANTVAGDYYDVFARTVSENAQQNYLFVIADVAGKSIPAALLMATFQASLKTLSSAAIDLVQLVEHLNRSMTANSQGGLRFTTAFFGEYDPATRALAYINAGHNAPILRRASGSIERLDAGGLPLGIQEAAAYQTGAVTLQSKDWLIIFTDGVVEAVNERDEEFGEQRLISIFSDAPDTAPSRMLSRVMVAIDLYVGNAPQHDDITCLLVKAA